MKKRLVGMLAVALVAGMVVIGCAKSDPEEDFEVNVLGGGRSVEIVGYVGSKWDIKIPSRIRKLPVTHIGDRAFSDENITNIVIPNGVITIGDSAFSHNQLTSVTIPNSVTTIGNWAFSSNQLTGVIIGNNVTSIGFGAFSNNNISALTIGNNVTEIGAGAFYNNQLTGVTIPDGVTSIGDEAFLSNPLTGVTIPSSVTKMSLTWSGDDQRFVDGPFPNMPHDMFISSPNRSSSGLVNPTSEVIPGNYTYRDGKWSGEHIQDTNVPAQQIESSTNGNNAESNTEINSPALTGNNNILPRMDFTRHLTFDNSYTPGNTPIRMWGWSNTGKVAYSTEYGYDSGLVQFTILDIITDQTVFLLDMNLYNYNLTYSEESIERIYEIEMNKIMNALNEHNIIQLQVDFMPFPLIHNNFNYNCRIIERKDDDYEYHINGYSVVVSRNNQNKTIKTHNGLLHKAYVCGYFKSPFEDRIMVVIAEEAAHVNALNFRFSGCHLDVGFN